MNNSSKAAKSIIIMIILTLGSKLLGFVREILIASNFGSGMETDTYFMALTITALVTVLISESISTTFIPVISQVEAKEGQRSKINHTSNMINVVFVISIILTIISFIFAPIIIKVIARGFQGEQFNLAVKLSRIGLPMIMFSGIIGILTGYLQSEERFTSTSLMGIPFNIVYILFLWFFSSKFGIKGLMVAGVVAVASKMFILIPETKVTGYKHRLNFDLKDIYLKKMLILSIPVVFGTAINEINMIVDKTIASNLVPGSISALNYAGKLNGLVNSVFIVAITTVIFPMLSKQANSGKIDEMKEILKSGFNIILLITIPASIGMISLAKPIVQVAFQRGEFGPTATLMTKGALVFYAIGLLAFSLRILINKVFYSLQDTKTPTINAIVYFVLNLFLSILLSKFMGHEGIALATSISSIISIIILIYILKKKIGSLGTKSYIITFIKTGIASGIMGLLAYFLYQGTYKILGVSKIYNFISLLVAVGIGGLVYLLLCYMFKVDEVINVVEKINERFIKR